MKFKIAVLGATGYIGSPYRQEIRQCQDDATIVSLCARRQNNLAAAAKEDGAEFFSDNWQKVIAHPGVNLVLVCTPDALHHEAIMACAKQGVHVFCEKPVGVNAKEAGQMWDAYNNNKLGHFVPLWTRYIEIFRRAREVVRSGELGEIRVFNYRWHNPRPKSMPFTWRDDAEFSAGGSIADVGSHVYDTLRWILDDEAQRVLVHADVISPAKPDLGNIDLNEALFWSGEHKSSDAKQNRKGTTYDYASIAVQMQSGILGTIILSHAPFLRKGIAPELELHGTDASLSLDRITGALRIFRSDTEGETIATLPDKGLGNRFGQYVFPALRECICGNTTEHPGLDDGFRVQIFTDSAACSSKRGGWVNLSEIENEL